MWEAEIGTEMCVFVGEKKGMNCIERKRKDRTMVKEGKSMSEGNVVLEKSLLCIAITINYSPNKYSRLKSSFSKS